MTPLVSQWVVCVPAHHPAIDVIIVRIDLGHSTSIARAIAISRLGAHRQIRGARGLKALAEWVRLGSETFALQIKPHACTSVN